MSLLFWFYLYCGTIIAMLKFTSVVKIICNFGTLIKDKRQKAKYRKPQKTRNTIPDGKKIQETCQ